MSIAGKVIKEYEIKNMNTDLQKNSSMWSEFGRHLYAINRKQGLDEAEASMAAAKSVIRIIDVHLKEDKLHNL